MTTKKISVIGMIVSAIIALYFSFEAAPVVKLWHWFGYTFSMGNPLENFIPKLSFALFLVLFLVSSQREKSAS